MATPAEVIGQSLMQALYGANRVGARLADGRIYAGSSPETGKPIFTTSDDAPGDYTAGEAQDFAAKFNGLARNDWRVPNDAELKILFRNRVAIGRFDTSGVRPGGLYRSSTAKNSYSVTCIFFDDGREIQQGDDMRTSLRLVCG